MDKQYFLLRDEISTAGRSIWESEIQQHKCYQIYFLPLANLAAQTEFSQPEKRL